MSADDYLTLDEMAKDVARMVDSAETHLGPVSEWSDSFKWSVDGLFFGLYIYMQCHPTLAWS